MVWVAEWLVGVLGDEAGFSIARSQSAEPLQWNDKFSLE
jgi:hypothetical protein